MDTRDLPGIRTPAEQEVDYVVPSARAKAMRANAARQRNEGTRRRRIDPTTCERDYDTAEIEFMKAIQDYKQRSGRQFPTWSEVLEVVRSLGYAKS